MRSRTANNQEVRACRWLWYALLGALLLSGCATSPRHGHRPQDLAQRLRALGPAVDAAEASLAAETACSYSLQLAKQYRVVRPAIFHNVLVNLGIRQRGLCFQWADDLSGKIASLNLQTLEMHRGVARLQTRREHSSVVLTAPGQAFEQGIVLDAWRHSGHLVWAGVKQDKYPWIEVEVIPEDEPRARSPASPNLLR